MRKTLLTAMALAVPLLASPFSALEKEHQELYPIFKGDGVTSIKLDKSLEGYYVAVEFDTDRDGNGDTRYFYRIKGVEEGLFLLETPFAVIIDRNGNRKPDDDEWVYLNGETSEELEPRKPIEPFQVNPYPNLRGDYLVSIGFNYSKRGLSAFFQYSVDDDRFADIMYRHRGYPKEMGIIFLETPDFAYRDLDKDAFFNFDTEGFPLRKELTEEPEKKGWDI